MAEIKDCCSCVYATRSTFCDICVACGVDFKNYTEKPKPKPRKKRKTHYDEVRSMKVKELAEWLYAHKWSNPDSALAWLKQEIAEEK